MNKVHVGASPIDDINRPGSSTGTKLFVVVHKPNNNNIVIKPMDS